MTHTLITLVLILAFVLCPKHAHPQDTNAELREKAFKLLDSAAGQLSTLQSGENRARIGANIADSLWNHDEKRARALVALIQDDIRSGLMNRDLEDPQDLQTFKVFLKLRVETVERIAKYDAELALAFLKATEFTSDGLLPEEVAESQRGLEIRLAQVMVNNNPAVALKLGRQSLTHGFSPELLTVLRELNRRDREHALILYKEVVNKLVQTDLSNDRAAEDFAAKLIYFFKPATPNDPTFRNLVGIFVTRALAMGCGGKLTVPGEAAEYCRHVASMLPQIEKVDVRAAQLKHWTSDLDVLDVPPEAMHEMYDLLQEGTVEELVAFAPKYPGIQQDIYWAAVRRATENGDLDQARKILTEHIPDSESKQWTLADLNRSKKAGALDDEKLAEIESRISEIPNAARMHYLLSTAIHFAGPNRKVASKLLQHAAGIVDTMKPGKDQTHAQMRLATAYCLIEDDRGFAIMESLMPKINELVDAAIKLDGYETQNVRDGEWNMSANGSVGDMLTGLSENARYFAWCDFDRAVSLSAQFQRSEIRLMAQVKLAQAILAGPPTRSMEVVF